MGNGISATFGTDQVLLYDVAPWAQLGFGVANFGDNLKNDASAKYWVYFSTLPGAGNDFGETGALIVDDKDGVDMAGDVSGQSFIQKQFAYDTNVQGGRTAAQDAAITVVGIGLTTGQYVKATGTIQRTTSNSVSLVAALERNYANPV